MAVMWIKTKHPGVRYYEHESRRHGVKKDVYFAIRFQAGGKRREEGLGWASQGWTAEKASQTLAKLKEAARTGEGASTLQEKRRLAAEKRKAEAEARAREELENIPFSHIFTERYFPLAQKNKAERSWKKEEQTFRIWIAPVIGEKPLKDIAPIHLERIKKNMAEAGRTPRSITYALAVIRQVFNFARDNDLFAGQNPVTKVKKPSADNRRVRFLSHEEANRLLEALARKSPQVRDMAMLSLHCGLRAGEIFSLTWNDVDLARGVLTLRDTKSGKTRSAIMTEAVKDMLAAKTRRGPQDWVFPSETGAKIGQISKSFIKTVNAQGLNDGVEDSRQKVVFHTLRHTFASWLVEQGVDLFTVKELMGHETLAMTTRYSHLAPNTLRKAVKTLEAGMRNAATGKKVIKINGQE